MCATAPWKKTGADPVDQVEYAILKLFMQNPGRALSREDVLTAVWGRDYDGELKLWM